jgi:hypothetical protein
VQPDSVKSKCLHALLQALCKVCQADIINPWTVGRYNSPASAHQHAETYTRADTERMRIPAHRRAVLLDLQLRLNKARVFLKSPGRFDLALTRRPVSGDINSIEEAWSIWRRIFMALVETRFFTP